MERKEQDKNATTDKDMQAIRVFLHQMMNNIKMLQVCPDTRKTEQDVDAEDKIHVYWISQLEEWIQMLR
jgi:predicted transcriptional regulator